MPPYRDPNRLFYDPANPVMLSTDQMQQLSPLELQAATDQLDQHLILVLQQIEENFAKCNQVVVESLLPAVEQHGENSMRIFESIKFWRPFFEAAASIRLHEPYGDDAASVATEEPNQTSASPDRTISSAGDRTHTRDSYGSDDQGTPRASHHYVPSINDDSSLPSEPHWSTDQHQDQLGSPVRTSQQPLPANSAMKQPAHAAPDQQLQRLRLRDLPPDSPDVPEPEFETAVFGGISRQGTRGGGDKGKDREFDESQDPSSPSFSLLREPSPSPSPADSKRANEPSRAPASPRNIRAGGGDKAHSKLLDKILRKNLASPAVPGSSTPGRPTRHHGASKMKFPSDVPREWDGIANLSHTALDAFPSPIKRRQSTTSTTAGGDDDSFSNMMMAAGPASNQRLHPSSSSLASYLTSSPAPKQPTTSRTNASSNPTRPSQFASSPSKMTRTPAKYAARLTAQNVYDSLGLSDSPLPSPPSILRTNHKPFNLYEHTQRLSIAPTALEDAEQEQYSPTTDRNEIRAHSSTSRNLKPENQEDASVAYSNASSILPNQPSFVGSDTSHTRPFNLYQHTQEQQQQHARGEGTHAKLGDDDDDDRTDNIDDLLSGKTMTFKQEQRMSLAPPIQVPDQHLGVDLGGIVDDDEEHYDSRRNAQAGSHPEDDDLSYVDEAETIGNDQEGQHERDLYQYGIARDEDESFNIERGLTRGNPVGGGGGFGHRLMDGPEDTLFGMPPSQPPPPAAAAAAMAQPRFPATGLDYPEADEDTFTQEPLDRPANNSRGFRLHGLSDMETLHGGELLSSEPFQASPLAGRWGLGGGGSGQQ
ncbi:uncharacterized protein JCM15063_004029 [Sporobolomyces koalae]|uniref:uncharacterized protein n=1 Tax=Sporobolomyces koalae TaxID=500713 RepID=UPI00316C43EA